MFNAGSTEDKRKKSWKGRRDVLPVLGYTNLVHWLVPIKGYMYYSMGVERAGCLCVSLHSRQPIIDPYESKGPLDDLSKKCFPPRLRYQNRSSLPIRQIERF